MSQIALSIRFCLVLCFSLGLAACSVLPPPTAPAGAGTVSQITISDIKKCPASLLGLNAQQAKGLFLTCSPDKDGTVFVDELEKISLIQKHQDVWLLIDTQKMQLEVKQGEQTVLVLSNIAVGRSGAGIKTRRGDDITPLGEYKIGWVNEKSQFHTFYGLTYPSAEDAKTGLSKGIISQNEYDAIIYAQQHDLIPPQTTALGGRVGVHGLGRGDERIHKLMNWTHGCVALTNTQIDTLDEWIEEGMRVKIK
jgi:murein L,D-transpeptidase YafK